MIPQGLSRGLRHEPSRNGSRAPERGKSPGFVMSPGRRALGWFLLLGGVALVAWALSP